MIALAIVVVGIIIGVVLAGLKSYTHHGEEITVPNVCGLYQTEADIIVEEAGMRISVIDSTYTNIVPLGTIVEQNPTEGAKVKRGRNIYVILNASAKRMIPMPEIKDMSLRQAQATLRAMQLDIDTIIYEPSEYRNLVLDIRQDTTSIPAGTRLEEGTSLTLVIGQGSGTEQVPVPQLIGKKLEDARSAILRARLTIGATIFAEPKDQHKNTPYFVYQQYPQAGDMILEGSRVDLSLSVDSTYTIHSTIKDDEEDFFN